MASPNDVLRASTHLNNKIELSRLTDDAETCRDDYSITNGAEDKKRRAHVVTLTNLSAVQTEVKGSLFVPPFYGAYPNDASATQTNVTHDSYGQDHEIPMQGVFPAEWLVNQHRHVDLNQPWCSDFIYTNQVDCEAAVKHGIMILLRPDQNLC